MRGKNTCVSVRSTRQKNRREFVRKIRENFNESDRCMYLYACPVDISVEQRATALGITVTVSVFK